MEFAKIHQIRLIFGVKSDPNGRPRRRNRVRKVKICGRDKEQNGKGSLAEYLEFFVTFEVYRRKSTTITMRGNVVYSWNLEQAAFVQSNLLTDWRRTISRMDPAAPPTPPPHALDHEEDHDVRERQPFDQRSD